MTGFPGPVSIGGKGFVGPPGKGGSPETKREKGNRRPQGMIGPQGTHARVTRFNGVAAS